MVQTLSSLYPVAIVQDRYGGVYSGGTWLAVANADRLDSNEVRINWLLNNGPFGGDVEAAEFWTAPPAWITSADTPDSAMHSLIAKFLANV